MTMGFDDDGDPQAGGTEEAVDNVDDRMDYEETTYAFLKNLEKNSGSTSLQKEAEMTGMKKTIGTAEEGMDPEQTAETPRWQLMKNSSTSTRTTTAATGMKIIEEADEGQEDEEEEQDELGMKTRNWRKINLSFTIALDGQNGYNIRAPDVLHNENNNNDNKMKHHPIMSKIAKFMIAVEKKCNTVNIMSSKSRWY
jgi:hypothetical protein